MTSTLDTTPAPLDIVHYLGDELRIGFNLVDPAGEPLVFTGTWTAMWRKTRTSATSIDFEIEVEDDMPVISMDVETQRTLAEVGVWDLQLTVTPDADPSTILTGRFLIKSDVTR